MFTIQVWFQRHWKWGVRQYSTLEEANARVQELAKVGIKSRVRLTSELYA
jgi:hypothetical protein